MGSLMGYQIGRSLMGAQRGISKVPRITFPPIADSSPGHHDGRDLNSSRLPQNLRTGIQCRSGCGDIVDEQHGGIGGNQALHGKSTFQILHAAHPIETRLLRRGAVSVKQ